MRKVLYIVLLQILFMPLNAQIIRDFSPDTALYRQELVHFTGSALESTEVPDFERFLLLYDSLPHENRMEIIDLSNLLLDRKARPRPQFIAFQRIMTEFLAGDKKSHGYEQWLQGARIFLTGDDVSPGAINQWLSVSLNLLTENIFYTTNAVTWKLSTPSFRFLTGDRMLVHCEDVTVACYSGRDFIQIMHASGIIDPRDLEWIGSGGTVTWDRVGIPEGELHATLDSYRINLKTPGYTADSVRMLYPAYFEGEVLGRLEDKVTLIKSLETAKYPQFVSYRNSYAIEGFAPGVDYRGGLSVEGANLAGTGVEGKKALLEIFTRDTLRFRVLVDRTTMNDKFIRSPSAEVSIYFARDSIFHPDVIFSYDIAKEELRLNKSEDFTSQGPYSNSYHNIDMNFDELFWNRSESTMRFQALQGTSIGRATFESNTFFNYDYYLSLQGMDYSHPLVQLYSYSNMVEGKSFAVTPYAKHIAYPDYQVRHLLMGLSKAGFLYFDNETDLVTLRDKLFDYIQASMRQRHYDVINFVSRTEGAANAEFNLETRDLTIRGIPVIFLSDSQNVRLVPRGSNIVMKRNRSFQFNGMVDAGLFRFHGSNFFFDYDSFKINLQQIDSLQLSTLTGQYNQYGEAYLNRIDNKIENMTGVLLIDEPFNKSGLDSNPRYPMFTSRENSYIFFDEQSIQNGVYSREEFYFELKPFEVDSLDNFRRESIALEGRFISASILPEMEMQMTLRDDNSLGFYMQTPPEGLPVYGGMGKFFNDIEMSSKGLHGYGTFDFLTSTTWSDDFLMHPDSMMAMSRKFLVREKLETTGFPYVENTETNVTLYPREELLQVNRIRETFRMFEDSIYHGGNLALKPTGLEGEGVTALPQASLESDRFRYGARSIRADSAGVRLKVEEAREFPFLTNDVKLDIDLDQRTGTFTANADHTLVELPYNLYETRVDRMTWEMDREEVILSQQKLLAENNVDIGIDSLRINAPTYLSKNPEQDELAFVAPEAVYNYRTRMLHARKVPFIEVADAYIFPHNGEVEIGYQAAMVRLENAKILADQVNRQHLVYNASIGVNGALDYTGSGYYEYRDRFGNVYPVHFDRIRVDTTLQTRSSGKVEVEDDFMLSPYFDFYGEVHLSARDPLLTFDGGTRIVHDCDIGRGWLRFTARLDPEDIRIPVEEGMQNTNLNKIFAGTMITRDSTHIYSAFLSARKDYFDAPITRAFGTLIYDPGRESYLLSSPEKLVDTTRPGHYLRLETAACRLYGEGPVNMTVDYGHVKLTAAGNATHEVTGGLFSAHLLLGLDFHFSPEALRIMGSEIDSLPDLEPVNLTTPHYRLGMKDLLGEDLALRLERQLQLTGMYDEIPPQWDHTIFFNDLTLEWNQLSQSFRYNGKVGIGNIGGIQVNKKVDAYMELVERGSGDVFDIYLKVGPNTWYYMAYSPGGLQVLSSNRTFNDLVYNLKASDRRVRAKQGEAQYIYSLAAARRLELFIERFEEFEEPEEEGEVF